MFARMLRSIFVVIAILVLADSQLASAQLQSGNLYAHVGDEAQQSLPGVTITLTGADGNLVQVTDAEGRVRFLGLAPGNYAMRAELEGFSTVEYPNLEINVGRNTSVDITLSPAIEEVITTEPPQEPEPEPKH